MGVLGQSSTSTFDQTTDKPSEATTRNLKYFKNLKNYKTSTPDRSLLQSTVKLSRGVAESVGSLPHR